MIERLPSMCTGVEMTNNEPSPKSMDAGPRAVVGRARDVENANILDFR